MTDHDLEDLFAAARAAPPPVPATLMAQVQADALALQPKARGQGGVASWLRGIGGLPGLGGLIAATVTGLWIGVAPPEALPDVAGLLLSGTFEETAVDSNEYVTGFGWDLEEG